MLFIPCKHLCNILILMLYFSITWWIPFFYYHVLGHCYLGIAFGFPSGHIWAVSTFHFILFFFVRKIKLHHWLIVSLVCQENQDKKKQLWVCTGGGKADETLGLWSFSPRRTVLDAFILKKTKQTKKGWHSELEQQCCCTHNESSQVTTLISRVSSCFS